MNLVNAFVTQILSEPYNKYGKWWVKVEYNSYGGKNTADLMFYSYEKAKSLEKGYEFNT